MDRGQAVAELVRDARGQLAEPREAVLQPQLIFQLDHVAEIGEQADRAVLVTGLVANRRDGDAEMRRARSPGRSIFTARRTIGRRMTRHSSMTSASGVELGEHLAVVTDPLGIRKAEQLASGRIERPDDAVPRLTTSRPDVRLAMISPLNRSDASARALHGALLRAHLLQRLLHRRGHERGLGATLSRGARGRSVRPQGTYSPRTRECPPARQRWQLTAEGVNQLCS